MKKFLGILGLCLVMSGAHAASVSLTPSAQDVLLSDGTATLDLVIDFTDVAGGTTGGGINLAFGGSIGFESFTPSPFYNSLDPVFSKHNATDADAGTDYFISFGTFAGINTAETLGTITVSLLGLGLGTAEISLNSLFGGFDDVPGGVTFNNATITAVPVPAVGWLMLSGVAVVFSRARRRQ